MGFKENLASEEGLYKNISAICGYPPQTVQELEKIDHDLDLCMGVLQQSRAFLSDRIFGALAGLAIHGPYRDIERNVKKHVKIPAQELCFRAVNYIRYLTYHHADARVAVWLDKIASESLDYEVRKVAIETLSLTLYRTFQPVVDLLEKQAEENSNASIRAKTRYCILGIACQNDRSSAMLDVVLRVLEKGTHDRDLEARLQAFGNLTSLARDAPSLNGENCFHLIKIFQMAVENGGPSDLLITANIGKHETLKRLAQLHPMVS